MVARARRRAREAPERRKRAESRSRKTASRSSSEGGGYGKRSAALDENEERPSSEFSGVTRSARASSPIAGEGQESQIAAAASASKLTTLSEEDPGDGGALISSRSWKDMRSLRNSSKNSSRARAAALSPSGSARGPQACRFGGGPGPARPRRCTASGDASSSAAAGGGADASAEAARRGGATGGRAPPKTCPASEMSGGKWDGRLASEG